MKTPATLAGLLVLVGCAEIQTVVPRTGQLPAGSAITLHMLSPEGAGLEHALVRVLTEAGFDVRSQAPVSAVLRPGSSDQAERVMRYDTPFVCRVRAMGYGGTITSFNLQVLEVSTGRILISQSGQDGTWSASTVAGELRKHLK